jgi:phosphogluconate dehydratase
VRAPAVVVADQQDLLALYQQGRLQRDFIAVVRYQGPQANGMPELHKLMPPLGALQDQGFQGGAGHRWAHVGGLQARCPQRSI